MTGKTPGRDIPGTLLLDPQIIEDPYPFYDRLRREAPVWHVPDTDVVAVTSFEAIHELVGRTEDFSNQFRNLLYRDADGLPRQLPFDTHIQAMAAADPPVHTVHRRAVFPELVARRMAALEPDAEKLTRNLLKEFVARGGGDFMHQVGNAVPIALIAHLIGFRDSDLGMLLRAAFNSTLMVGGTATLEELMQLVEGSLNTNAWITERLHAGDAGDDTILAAISRAIAADVLTPDEGVVILHNLLSAGGESTASLIGNAVRILAEREDLQTYLRAHRELVPNFIEEVLRLESPFRYMMRSTPSDTELMGVHVPAGASVLVFFSAANRDPDEFEDAAEFRLDRATPKAHLAFGRGIHFCVGAPLARLEANVVVSQALDVTSSIRLDPEAPPRRVYSLLVRRHEKLPITVV
jgi:cytochrome P450